MQQYIFIIKRYLQIYFPLYFISLLLVFLLISNLKTFGSLSSGSINIIGVLIMTSSINLSGKNEEDMYKAINYSRRSYVKSRAILALLIPSILCSIIFLLKLVSITLGSSYSAFNLISDEVLKLDYTFLFFCLYSICQFIILSSFLLFDASLSKPLFILHYNRDSKESINGLRIIFGNILLLFLYIIPLMIYSGITIDLLNGISLMGVILGIIIPLIISAIFYILSLRHFQTHTEY